MIALLGILVHTFCLFSAAINFCLAFFLVTFAFVCACVIRRLDSVKRTVIYRIMIPFSSFPFLFFPWFWHILLFPFFVFSCTCLNKMEDGVFNEVDPGTWSTTVKRILGSKWVRKRFLCFNFFVFVWILLVKGDFWDFSSISEDWCIWQCQQFFSAFC